MQFSLHRSLSVWAECWEDCGPPGHYRFGGTSCTLTPGISRAAEGLCTSSEKPAREPVCGVRNSLCTVCFKEKNTSFPTLNWNCNPNSVVSLISCLALDKLCGGGRRGKETPARVLKEAWNRTLSCPRLRLFRIRAVGKGSVFQVLQYWTVIYL